MIRVVLTGSESTGKTTLAGQLSRHFGAPLIPEFVRDYVARKAAPVSFGDHGPIARGQMALEDVHAESTQPLAVQDTDLLSTVVYCEHYFGTCPAWIVDEAAARRPDLYLLCEIDVPWIADDVRDRGHMRDEMQALFRAAVGTTGVPTAAITGNWDERFQRAVDAIDSLLLTVPPSA
ncbi:MAG TPA: ATP-binding protein [Gemmatimonadaceae bacterium]|jgi:NadR type nicotinamide-nucleotide adenylyltransferase